MTNFSHGECPSNCQREDGGVQPKIEVLDFSLPNESTSPGQIQATVASSSRGNLRSSLIGMGFKPSLVDRAIDENGESNIEVLLEALFSYSKPKPEGSPDALLCYNRDTLPSDTLAMEPIHRSNSSDSLESWFGDNNDSGSPLNYGRDVRMKEENDVSTGVAEEKKASLLKMSFSLGEIKFAIDKLGEDALINELVDFIFAARIAKNCERDGDAPSSAHDHREKNKECNPETLFGTMEKTLRLLEMGFTENEISAAIDRHVIYFLSGSEVPIQVLADSIVAYQNSSPDPVQEFTSLVKVEGCSSTCEYGNFDLPEKLRGKRPKEEYTEEPRNLKWPKEEYDDYSSASIGPTWVGARNGNRRSDIGPRVPASRRQVRHKVENLTSDGMQGLSMPKSCKSLDSTVAEPPYFFYGNVANLSRDSWVKVSQFLYEIEPEFVNTRGFSALNRDEGYVHNLPTHNRFRVEPKPPMSIDEAMPHTKKWWPSWDTRKHISCISPETSGVVCDRLKRMLIAKKGLLSGEQQRDVIHQCQVSNLVWVGQHQLAPIEPEKLELILGYPVGHTRAAGFNLAERLESLKNSFQVDTLAYHMSVLKPLFPGGLTVLSVYSGIGGAEIALDKLGIHLKGVVSVEPSEIMRRTLKQWWGKSGQSGELVQIEGIQSISSSRLESLIKRFGGFDLVICQNPSANSSQTSKAIPVDSTSLDFSMFCEFVRVLQRVRSTKERNR